MEILPINIALFSILILMGAASIYCDFALKKIPNKLVLAVLVSVLPAVFFHFGQPLFWENIPYFLLNFGIAAAVALFFWQTGVWSAGYAKLFVAFSLLAASALFGEISAVRWVTVALALNIFLAAFGWLFLDFCFMCLRIILSSKYRKNIRWKPPKPDLEFLDKRERPIWNIGGLLRDLAGFFVVFYFLHEAISFAVGKFGIEPAPRILGIFLIFMFAGKSAARLFRNDRLLAGGVLVLAAKFFFDVFSSGADPQKAWGSLALSFLALFVVWVKRAFLRRISFFYIANRGISRISVEDLKPGMRVSIFFLRRLFTGGKNLPPHRELERELDGEGIALISSLARERGIETVGVHKDFPFAVWMFAGTVATLLTGGRLLFDYFF